MTDFEHISLEKRWKEVLKIISVNYGNVDEIKDILFLIGVQELGQGFRMLNKSEKVDVMHIGLCKVLSYFGYYTFKGRDNDGWPHWDNTNEIPQLTDIEKETLFKEAIITYFETE